MKIRYFIADWEKHKKEISSVRYKVFVIGQNVPIEREIDDDDKRYTHFLAMDGDKPIGTARLTLDGHVGRVAVLKGYRKFGVGKELMMQLEEAASEMGFDEIKLNSQLQAIPFYEKLGYEAYGRIFIDAGIEHRCMKKRLI